MEIDLHRILQGDLVFRLGAGPDAEGQAGAGRQGLVRRESDRPVVPPIKSAVKGRVETDGGFHRGRIHRLVKDQRDRLCQPDDAVRQRLHFHQGRRQVRPGRRGRHMALILTLSGSLFRCLLPGKLAAGQHTGDHHQREADLNPFSTFDGIAFLIHDVIL